MTKLSKKILKKGYALVDVGRGDEKSYKAPRAWFEPAIDKLWKVYSTPNSCPFFLVDSKPNSSKFQFGIVAGECLPIKGGRVVVSPRNQLNEQHGEQLDAWIHDGYVEKDWSAGVRGIKELYEKIRKWDNPNYIFEDEFEEDDFNKIKNISFIVLDELHLYSKNRMEDIKMLTYVLNFLQKHNLKLALGTTATGKNLKAIWEWAGKQNFYFVKQDLYTYRPSKELLAQDGWQEVPTSWVWADQKTYLVDLMELEKNNVDINDSEAVKKYYFELDHTDANLTTADLKDAGHQLNWRDKYKDYQTQYKTYMENRIDAAMKHIIRNKKYTEPTLIQVYGIENGIKAQQDFSLSLGGRGAQILAWNSKTKATHPLYRNNEKKMLEDFLDPTHPLKILVIDEMLTTGTNKPIVNVYKTSYSKNSVDNAIQVIYRGRVAYIVFDAIVLNSFSKSVKARLEELKKHMDKAGLPYDQRKLQQIAGVWEAKSQMNENDNDGHKHEDPINVDQEQCQSEAQQPLQHGEELMDEKLWVVGFDNNKQTIKAIKNEGSIHVSLPQKARSLIDVFGVN